MLRIKLRDLANLVGNSKRKNRLHMEYGRKPDIHYFAEDMTGIRAYYDYRNENDLDDFLIDDTTWNDLSMDDIYKRINMGLSTSGEQILYYLLRSPSIEKSEYDKRAKMIEIMEKYPDLRHRQQIIFAGLGRKRTANTYEMFSPSVYSTRNLFLYISLVTLFVGSIAAMAFTTYAIALFLCFVVFIPIYHQMISTRIESDLATVNNTVAMVHAQKRIKKLSSSELDDYLNPLYEAGDKLKSITSIGSVTTYKTDSIMQLINSMFLLDLIAYELLWALGQKENAISIAATHDIELCMMLDGIYRMYHFEETITEHGEIQFEYIVKPGIATTRNALKLLSSIGFDREIVDRANARANRYMSLGKWE